MQKKSRQTLRDSAVEKTKTKTLKHLKDNGLLAVPFDQGVGFCIMKIQTYKLKLESLEKSAHFVKKEAITDEMILEFEKKFKKEILAMKNRDDILEVSRGNPPYCTV